MSTVNALLPAQAAQAGKVLATDGTNTAWTAINAPSASAGSWTPTLSWDGNSQTLSADRHGDRRIADSCRNLRMRAVR